MDRDIDIGIIETLHCFNNAYALAGDTIRAIDDVRHGRNLSRAFSSVEELMEDLNAED